MNRQQRLRARIAEQHIRLRKLARQAGIGGVRLDAWQLGVIALRPEEVDRVEWALNRAESVAQESIRKTSYKKAGRDARQKGD